MHEIKYQNSVGTVTMCGVYGSEIGITSLSGFGLPTKSYTNIEFAFENGLTEIGCKDTKRTITIGGEMNDKSGYLRRNMSRVLHESGELICSNEIERRKIGVKTVKPPEFDYQGGGLYSFSFQLQADYPYFTDIHETVTNIYSLKNLVTETFTLPCIFTKSLSEGVAHNIGDKYTYPILTVENTSDSKLTGPITVTNITTGAFVKINRDLAQNECVTIDLETRDILSSKDGDVTSSISDDTDLSAFYLKIGENKLKAEHNSQEGQLKAQARFYNEYYSMEVR